MDTFPVIISFSDSTNGLYFEATQFEFFKKKEQVILIRLSLIKEDHIKLLEVLIGVGALYVQPTEYLIMDFPIIKYKKLDIQTEDIKFKGFLCTSAILRDQWEEIIEGNLKELELEFAKDF